MRDALGALALISAPGGRPRPVVAHFARLWAARGVQICPIGDVGAAREALSAQPAGTVRHLRLLGHGFPGALELGLGELHLRRHFVRAATAGDLFTHAAVSALHPEARIDLVGCRTAASLPLLADAHEPDRFDGVALLEAVARLCPGREVRGPRALVWQSDGPDPPLPVRIRVAPDR